MSVTQILAWTIPPSLALAAAAGLWAWAWTYESGDKK
jgi:hypothetical protein